MNTVERVKMICKERKIAISKLESDCGFSNGYIGQLRKGVFPNDRLVIIADYFDMSVDFLMTGKEDEVPSPNSVKEHVDLISKYEKLNPSAKLVVMALLDELIKNNNKGE